MEIQISPSLMCMDLLNVQKEIEILSPVSSQFHLDIIDWHYCKNLCLSPMFMQQLKTITDTPLEAHLMMDNIDIDLIEYCLKCGADIIILPPEIISSKAFRIIGMIKAAGKKFGVFLNPGASLDIILPYAKHIDLLVMMTVDPGYLGQKFIPDVLEKIQQAKELREKKDFSYKIEVDGGCGPETYEALYKAGAEIFVMGTSGLFKSGVDIKTAWDNMSEDIQAATGCFVEKTTQKSVK